MFGFLNRIEEMSRARKQSAAAEYRSLITKAAKDGDLSDKDGRRLHELANELKIPMTSDDDDVPSASAHAALIARESELAGQAAKLDEANGVYKAAIAKSMEFDRETERLIRELTQQREAGHREHESEYTSARRAVHAAELAAAELSVVRCRLHDYAMIAAGNRTADEAAEIWRADAQYRMQREAQALGHAPHERPLIGARELANRIRLRQTDEVVETAEV